MEGWRERKEEVWRERVGEEGGGRGEEEWEEEKEKNTELAIHRKDG